MAKKTLTIEGITFPDFITPKGKNDNSKKNFRLIFYIGYRDEEGKKQALVVSKPEEGHWQWRNSKKDAFLPSTISGNSAELDTSVLNGGNGFSDSDGTIAEIDGELTSVTVQFTDVHDKTPLDTIINDVFPELIKVWKASGFNPIDMTPIPGGVKGVIKDKVNLEDLADKAVDYFKKQLKDKLLCSVSIKKYNGENPLVLRKDNVKWNAKEHNKEGTYAVTIGIE